MKILHTILFAMFIAMSSYSQDKEPNDDFQTIIGGENLHITGFGGPMMNFSAVDGEFTLFMGGGGAAIFNDRFFLGGFGKGMTNAVDISDPALSASYDHIEFGYGGIWLGYIFSGNHAIHPVFHTQLGFGGISFQNENDFSDEEDDGVFVLEPGLELEMNITHFFRLGAGINYRYVMGVDAGDYSSLDFSAPGGFLSFKFGWF